MDLFKNTGFSTTNTVVSKIIFNKSFRLKPCAYVLISLLTKF
jgi:hypothetical protein